MPRNNASDLKNELRQFIKGFGAYAVRVADPRKGFEKAILGCRPRDVWENCSSVVVFGVYVGPDYYRSLKFEKQIAGEDRVMHIFRDWLQYKLVEFIQEKGYNAVILSGYFNRKKSISRLSLKLAAYEAGLGVYGRCGIIITPRYGPRVNFGAVLTDASLKRDGKLTDFNPCSDCRLCVGLCPVKAIRADVSPPTSHDREKCVSFVQKLREKMSDKGFLCGYCYNSCPVGKTARPGFTLSQQRTLLDLPFQERERLISEVSLDLRIHD